MRFTEPEGAGRLEKLIGATAAEIRPALKPYTLLVGGLPELLDDGGRFLRGPGHDMVAELVATGDGHPWK